MPAMHFFRLLRIVAVSIRYGLDELLLGGRRGDFVRALFFWRTLDEPRAVRLRLALEALGPIFVKFGQVLSTRRDLLPPDIAEELAKLQDRVPPFPAADVMAILQRVYGRPAAAVFTEFSAEPVGSASVPQGHLARAPRGSVGAGKVVRAGLVPG